VGRARLTPVARLRRGSPDPSCERCNGLGHEEARIDWVVVDQPCRCTLSERERMWVEFAEGKRMSIVTLRHEGSHGYGTRLVSGRTDTPGEQSHCHSTRAR